MMQSVLGGAVVLVLAAVSIAGAQEPGQAVREEMYRRYLDFPSHVKGGAIEPHWMADGNSFWYADGPVAETVVWKVDPLGNTKKPLFDVARLRAALAAATGREPPHRGVPFREFRFRDGDREVEFDLEGLSFILRLEDYSVVRPPVPEDGALARGFVAPDGWWAATIRDRNLWFVSRTDGEAVQVSTDGIPGFGYDFGDGNAAWTPDGSVLAMVRVDFRDLPCEPVVRGWLREESEVRWYCPWVLPSGPRPRFHLNLIHRESRRIVPVSLEDAPGQQVSVLTWHPDGSSLYLLKTDRYQRQLELVAVDAETAGTRVVLTETSPTLVQMWQPWSRRPAPLRFLPDGESFIWKSERDGWQHLYLHRRDGTLLARLTTGEFPVVRVVSVDDEAGWVYFTARTDRQRPYDAQLCRVRLDGTGFERLAPETGGHDVPGQSPVRMAPSNQFFVVTHSTPSRPPATELRRADGTLVRVLSTASLEGLEGLRWRAPEEFVVKAADGETDLYGILYLPYDFDPRQEYPVVQIVYNRPDWPPILPTTFTSNRSGIEAQALAQLGYVTFILEGRGTSERGRAFQHAIYGRLGRVELEDQAGALRQLAAARPYMDLTRVGIMGDSYGGYLAIRALLLEPDLYRVGIASSPVATTLAGHPALYLGRPEENEEAYRDVSNVVYADRLKGRLLLIHGTAESLSSVFELIDALVRAGKQYDLVLLPDRDHAGVFSGSGGAYRLETVRRYFQEHLQGRK